MTVICIFFIDNTLDEIPTKEFSSVNKINSQYNSSVINKKNDNYDRSTFIMNNNKDVKEYGNRAVRMNDNYENCILRPTVPLSESRLSVSSVASISHIAELLNDMSVDTSPRIIVDRMLSAGKYCISIILVFIYRFCCNLSVYYNLFLIK